MARLLIIDQTIILPIYVYIVPPARLRRHAAPVRPSMLDGRWRQPGRSRPLWTIAAATPAALAAA